MLRRTLLALAGLLPLLSFQCAPAALAQATRPVPTSQPYAIDRVFYVSPAGSDATGDGSQAKPFASVAKADTAITVARYTRPTTSNDAILIQATTFDIPWTSGQGVNNDNCIVGVYGNTSPAQRAVFNFHGGGFQTSHSHVHFIGIDAEATNRNPQSQDIGFNVVRTATTTPDDVTFDNVIANGFAEGISFQGDNGSRVRVWNSFLTGSYWIQGTIPGKAQGLYFEGATPDIRYNVIAFNGWAGDLTNPAVVTALMFSHGVYDSASHNPKPGISTGNLYLVNAASGIQLRSGGTVFGDVFAGNGVACDAFTDGPTGDIVGNVALGCRDAGFLFTGGGFLGQSDRQTISGNILLRATPTGAAALNLGWNFVNGQPSNDITNLPPSALSLASMTGNYGVWPGPASLVTMPRTFQTIDANTFVAPSGYVPDLIDWARTVGFTGATHKDLVKWFEANPSQVNAASVIAWATPIARQLSAPQPVMVPAPAPAPIIIPATQPFSVILNVDPIGGKVSVGVPK